MKVTSTRGLMVPVSRLGLLSAANPKPTIAPPPIYQPPPRGLIRDLLSLAHLAGERPLPRSLHSEGEDCGVLTPGRVGYDN